MNTIEDTLNTLGPNARKLVKVALETARQCFNESGEAKPVILTLPERGQPQVYDACHANDDEKAVVWSFLRMLRTVNPTVVLVNEAWMSHHKKGDALPGEEGYVRPKDDPQREEYVMVNVYDGARMLSFKAQITRHPDHLAEWVCYYDSDFPDQHEAKGMGGELFRGDHYQKNNN